MTGNKYQIDNFKSKFDIEIELRSEAINIIIYNANEINSKTLPF